MPDAVLPCTVWLARTGQVRPGHAALLDPVELGRRAALRRPADRDRFTLAAALLRLAAAAATGTPPRAVPVERTCPDCGGPHGRPLLPGTGLHASVSHSGGRVAVALTRVAPVGVDVEQVQVGDFTALARDVLAPGERATGLFTSWCRKESVVKATGEGLRVPLREVVADPGRPVSYRGARLVATVADLPVGPGYAGALTVLAAGRLRVELRPEDELGRLLDVPDRPAL